MARLPASWSGMWGKVGGSTVRPGAPTDRPGAPTVRPGAPTVRPGAPYCSPAREQGTRPGREDRRPATG